MQNEKTNTFKSLSWIETSQSTSNYVYVVLLNLETINKDTARFGRVRLLILLFHLLWGTPR